MSVYDPELKDVHMLIFLFLFQNYISVDMWFWETFNRYHNFMTFSHKMCISPHQLKLGTAKGEPFTQVFINLKEHGLLGSYSKPYFLS